MPEDAFKRLVLRWDNYVEHIDNPKLADVEITLSMLMLNKVDGLVTIFSCQGHPTPEKPRAVGSMMFGVRDPKPVYRFYELLQDALGSNTQVVSLVLQRKKDVTLHGTPNQPWYPVWTVRWDVNVDNATETWLQVNNAAIQVAAEWKGVDQ
jgi:hypothetical protein